MYIKTAAKWELKPQGQMCVCMRERGGGTHTHMWVCMHMYVCAYGISRLMLRTILYYSVTLFTKRGSFTQTQSLSTGLAWLASEL